MLNVLRLIEWCFWWMRISNELHLSELCFCSNGYPATLKWLNLYFYEVIWRNLHLRLQVVTKSIANHVIFLELFCVCSFSVCLNITFLLLWYCVVFMKQTGQMLTLVDLLIQLLVIICFSRCVTTPLSRSIQILSSFWVENATFLCMHRDIGDILNQL